MSYYISNPKSYMFKVCKQGFVETQKELKGCRKGFQDVSQSSPPPGFSFFSWVCAKCSPEIFWFWVFETSRIQKKIDHWWELLSGLDGQKQIKIFGKEMSCWSNGDENHLRISIFFGESIMIKYKLLVVVVLRNLDWLVRH